MELRVNSLHAATTSRKWRRRSTVLTFINNFPHGTRATGALFRGLTIVGKRERGGCEKGKEDGRGERGYLKNFAAHPWDRICGWKCAPRWCEQLAELFSVRRRLVRMVAMRGEKNPSGRLGRTGAILLFRKVTRCVRRRVAFPPPDGFGRVKCKIENHSCKNDPALSPLPLLPSPLPSTWKFRQNDVCERYCFWKLFLTLSLNIFARVSLSFIRKKSAINLSHTSILYRILTIIRTLAGNRAE